MKRCQLYHFLTWLEHTHLAEADMEGGALKGAIGPLHNNDVNAPRQGRRVKAPVQLLDLHKHLTRQLTHIVHVLELERHSKGWCQPHQCHAAKG